MTQESRHYAKKVRALLVLPLIFCLAIATPAVAAESAHKSAAPVTAPTKVLNNYLARLWTKVLLTPQDQNPFGTGGQTASCIDLGRRTLAPFGPVPVDSCTVAPGTKIFVPASSVECSTFEGTPKPQLKNCAREADLQAAPSVTIDGKTVPVTEAETGLLHIFLKADNVFGLPAGTEGYSYGHGWVTLLRPLPPGTHTILITAADSSVLATTKINVAPGA